MRSTNLLYKILPTNLGACKPTLNIISEAKQYYEGLFLSYRPRAECSISQFCNTKCTHSIFRTIDRSTCGPLAKQLKKNFQSHFCRASCGRVWMNINRVTLQHNKEFIMVIFYLMVLSMCNLQKRLIRAAFWVLLQAMFTERLKTNGTAIKITRETTNNQ